MPNTEECLIIGKVISADIDIDGNIHLTLKNSNTYWTEYAVKHLRDLTNQIIEAPHQKMEHQQTTITPNTFKKTTINIFLQPIPAEIKKQSSQKG